MSMGVAAFSIAAAGACAICNGGASVLQKVSADKATRAGSLKLGLLWHLLRDWPYALGTTLDLLGWVLTFVAVQDLPLFLVESIIACSIAVTAVLERLFLRRALGRQAYLRIGIIAAGVVMLAVVAVPGHAHVASPLMQRMLALSVVPAVAVAAVLARQKRAWAGYILAAVSGIAYGQTSVISRIFGTPRPLWHVVQDPLLYGLGAFGVLGILLFSMALQRMPATVATATMTAAQTTIPTLLGIALFGDRARHGLWPVLVLGVALTTWGCISLCMHNRSRMLPPATP